MIESPALSQGDVIEITKKIYSKLGHGYKENIYHSAFEIELRKMGISFQSEVICPIKYNGIQIGFERADIVIYKDSEMDFIIEFKAQNCSLGIKEQTQARKYIKNFNISYGFLINFSTRLELVLISLDEHHNLHAELT